MNIFPAIDLLGGCAVRLFRGDYNNVTVYSEHPEEIAKEFEASGAKFMHIVDLDGARDGKDTNFPTIKKIIDSTELFCEVGGGIRSIETVKKYIDLGVSRVILGTAAVNNKDFLMEAVRLYQDKIAVGVDLKDGFVAIKGWQETSAISGMDFCREMEALGVKTIICTDISRDGAMAGTNHELYRRLSQEVAIDIVASGGVSSIDEVKRLRNLNIYGAIVGKAYYTGHINLREAIEVAK